MKRGSDLEGSRCRAQQDGRIETGFIGLIQPIIAWSGSPSPT